MKPLKHWFVLVMTLLFVLIVFAIADIALAGVIALAISIWDKVIAMSVFKWSTIVLFTIEAVLSVPAVIKSCKGDEK